MFLKEFYFRNSGLKQLLNAELVLPEKAGRQRNKRYVLNRTRIDLKFK